MLKILITVCKNKSSVTRNNKLQNNNNNRNDDGDHVNKNKDNDYLIVITMKIK